jgi:UDP:flavonoid glycosyltransferase YjiC (YdhE family)
VLTIKSTLYKNHVLTKQRRMSADSFYGYNTGVNERSIGGEAGEKAPPIPLEGTDSRPPPPAYSDTLGKVEDSETGAGTHAKVGDDGRVNIRINQRSHKLSSLLVPALRQQRRLIAEQAPLPPPYVPPTLGGSPGELPPPPMNVVIHVVGSRGDVQPFLALAKVLRDTYNHRVRLATHPVFKDFIEENGIEFFSIGGDPSELMAFMVKNPGLLPGFDTLRNGDVGKRRKAIAEMIKGAWRSCIEAGDGTGIEASDNAIGEWMTDTDSSLINDDIDNTARPFVADAIIANPPSFAHLHCAERLGIPLHMMFTMPWSPTEAFPHPLANIESTNAEQTISNYITYGLIDLLTWQGLGDIINRFRVHNLGLEPINIFYAPGMLARLKIPYTYCWSPALIPKPADWGNHINISGFYFLNLASNYTPAPDLKAFLDSGPPPVYIGFGSIVVDDPTAMTKMIFEAIKITGQRALVSKGWGGIGADELGIPGGVFMLGNVPHDWLFKHVSCVVHHGGAGTTAAGISLGKPTVIVPFFGDQPFWGSMVARAGAGPKPTRYKDLTAQILADSIMEALKPESLERAGEMARTIAQEKGCDVGAQSFHQMLDLDKMRCSVLPEQAAVWRIRKTQIRLSALAAYVLAEKEVISFSDLKLYRVQEYEVDQGPTDPISGGAGAIVDNATTIMMGVADFPVAALKALAIHPDAKKDKGKESVKDAKADKTAKIRTLENGPASITTSSSPSIAPTQITMTDTETTLSGHGSISTEKSSMEATPPTTPGMSTPTERDNRFASIERTASPEPLAKQTSLETASSPTSNLLSPTDAHSMSQSSIGTRKSSAMAEALRNLPESSRPRSRSNSRSRANSHRRALSNSESVGSQSKFKHWAEQDGREGTLDTFYGTGKGLSKIVGAGMKSPMDFTLGLAKGFHNMPKLYGEEVRQVDRVTDLKSGLRVAGKVSNTTTPQIRETDTMLVGVRHRLLGRHHRPRNATHQRRPERRRRRLYERHRPWHRGRRRQTRCRNLRPARLRHERHLQGSAAPFWQKRG